MSYSSVLEQIQEFIVANGSNDITADVLRPILESILGQPNELIGDLGDSTVEGSTIVEMLNTLKADLGEVAGITIHTGTDTPIVSPPVSFLRGDFFAQIDGSLTVSFWQFTGLTWVPIKNWINDSLVDTETTWSSAKIQETINLQDKILFILPPTYAAGNVTITTGAVWRIGGVVYTNPSDVVKPVANATAGMYRTDLLVANQLNSFDVIAGVESATIQLPPSAPIGTVAVTSINVFGSTIDVPAPTFSDFVKKSFSSAQVFTGAGSGVVIPLNYLGQSVIYLEGTMTSIEGFSFSELLANPTLAEYPYEGKVYRLFNRTANAITLVHEDGFENDLNFEFLSGQDYVLPSGEMAEFIMYSGMLLDVKEFSKLDSTSFISGAGISINAVTSKFDLQAKGVIINPLTFKKTFINVNVTAQTTTHIASQTESYVWIDNTGSIIQSLNPPIETDIDNIIGHWVLVHNNLSTINLTNSFPLYSDGVAAQLHQSLMFDGFRKKKGENIVGPGTTGTRLSHSGGLVIKAGGGASSKRPVFNLTGAIDATFKMRNRNDNSEADTQTFDVTNYDLAGTTTTMSNNKFGVAKVWKFGSSVIRCQRPQKQYDSFADALKGMEFDTYVDSPNGKRNGISVGWIIFKKGITWAGATVDVDYKFVEILDGKSVGVSIPTVPLFDVTLVKFFKDLVPQTSFVANTWYSMGYGSGNNFFECSFNTGTTYGTGTSPTGVPSITVSSLNYIAGKKLDKLYWHTDYCDQVVFEVSIFKFDLISGALANGREILNQQVNLTVAGPATQGGFPFAKNKIALTTTDSVDTPVGAQCSVYFLFYRKISISGGDLGQNYCYFNFN